MDKKVKLIEGEFSPEDAREVLTNLIEYKIQFHNRKNFSSEIKSGDRDEHSLQRIEELKKMKEQIKDLTGNAAPGTTFKINSDITITT